MKRFFKNKTMLPVLMLSSMLSVAFIVSPSDDGRGEGSDIPYSPAYYSMSEPTSPNLGDDLVPSTPGSSLIDPAFPDFDASPFSGDPFGDDFYAEAAGALRSPGCFVNTDLGSRTHSLEVDSPCSPAAASGAIVADASAAEAASTTGAQASAQSLTDSHVAVVVADTADRPKNKKAAKSGKASASSANAGSGGGGGGGSETVEVDGEKNVDAKVLAEVKRVISEESQAGDLTPVQLANKILRRVIKRANVSAEAGRYLFEQYVPQCNPLFLSRRRTTLLESSVLKLHSYFDGIDLLVQKIVSMGKDHEKRALELLDSLKIKQLVRYKKDLSGGVFRCLAKIYQAIQDLDSNRYPNTVFIMKRGERDSIMKDAVLRAIKNDLGTASNAKAASASSFSAESSSLSATASAGSGGGGGGGSETVEVDGEKNVDAKVLAEVKRVISEESQAGDLTPVLLANKILRRVIKRDKIPVKAGNLLFKKYAQQSDPLMDFLVGVTLLESSVLKANRYFNSTHLLVQKIVSMEVEHKKRALELFDNLKAKQLTRYKNDSSESIFRCLAKIYQAIQDLDSDRYPNTVFIKSFYKRDSIMKDTVLGAIQKDLGASSDAKAASASSFSAESNSLSAAASAGSGGGGGGGGGSGAAPVAKPRAAKRKLSGDRPVVDAEGNSNENLNKRR